MVLCLEIPLIYDYKLNATIIFWTEKDLKIAFLSLQREWL